MSNVVPVQTKLSPLNEYETQGDFSLINTLMKNPRYDIPEHLRKKVIQSAENSLDSLEASDATKLAAARLILEADKRNIEIMKLIIPQQHVHKNVKELPTEELEAIILEAHDKLIAKEER